VPLAFNVILNGAVNFKRLGNTDLKASLFFKIFPEEDLAPPRSPIVPPVSGKVSILGGHGFISETVRNRTHVHINFFLGMTNTMTAQNIDLSSWDILYI
jgi:hypothetical protein